MFKCRQIGEQLLQIQLLYFSEAFTPVGRCFIELHHLLAITFPLVAYFPDFIALFLYAFQQLDKLGLLLDRLHAQCMRGLNLVCIRKLVMHQLPVNSVYLLLYRSQFTTDGFKERIAIIGP